MSELQELLAFPPAPHLNLFGKIDPKKFGPDSPEMPRHPWQSAMLHLPPGPLLHG